MSSSGAEILFLMFPPLNLFVKDLFGVAGVPSAEALARLVVNALDNDDIFAS